MKPNTKNFTVTKLPTGKLFRSPQEVYAQQLKTKEAHIIIVDMNRDGHSLQEIRKYLEENGYVTFQLNLFTVETIRRYLKQRGHKITVNKKINTQSKYKPIGMERGVEALTCRAGKERPNIIKIALGVLNGRFRWDDEGYHLKHNGEWKQASLCEVMRETNKALKSQGIPQITVNANWVIK